MLTQEQSDYLDEHLPYMRKMLKYTYEQMKEEQLYLSWNAHFESFAVHARNLVAFLANDDKGNFKAHHFAPEFKAGTRDVGPLRKKLDEQVFHLAKRRPRTRKGKFNSLEADALKGWIDTNFANFLERLPAEARGVFNDTKADPDKDIPNQVSQGPTGPTGTASVAQNGPEIPC